MNFPLHQSHQMMVVCYVHDISSNVKEWHYIVNINHRKNIVYYMIIHCIYHII